MMRKNIRGSKLIMKKLILFSVIFAGLVTGCAKDEASTFGGISGVVKDKITAEALAGVRVSIMPGGDSSVTGEDGNFQFKDLEGAYNPVSFFKVGYARDSKKVTVSPGMNRDASVTLEPIVPVLSVSPAKLDFGSETTTLALDIKNTGKGSLQWSISEEVGWLSCLRASGETTNETSSVVVTVSRDGLERGNYEGTIVVSSNGGSQTVPVSLSVEDVKLEVSPVVLDYETTETSLQLTLRNGGSGTINYTVTSSNNWLIPNKKSGSVTQTDYITAVVSREGLSAGKYDATLEFTTDGGKVVVPVKMEVAAAAAPSVAIESASNVTYNSVLLRGTVLSVGSAKITRHGFCWSEHAEPTVGDACSDAGDCSEPKTFESIVSNLKSSTTYYVRAYAINDVGTAYSERELTFSTSASPTAPEVRTGSVDKITDVSARISASITALGNVAEITHYGHVWSETPQPTLQNGDRTDYGKTTETRSYISDLTGLAANTTYYVRAYAVNEIGAAYGDEAVFTTQKAAPSIETSVITGIGYSSAVGGGRVLNANGHSIVEKGLCWNTTGSPDTAGPHAIADANFVCHLTGLTASTAYYVRAYVKTSENLVYYGNQQQFTTIAAPVNPTSGLFAYYTFDGNFQNTVDGAPHGQGINSPTFTDGVNGSQAVNLSVQDNSYINIPEAMIDCNTFSISFWIKGLSEGHLFHVASTNDGSPDAYDNGYILTMKNGMITFWSGRYWYYPSYKEVRPFTHSSVDSSQWNMITLTFAQRLSYDPRSVTAKLYINGEFVDVVDIKVDCMRKGTKFIFGGKFEETTPPSMTIDNLRVYNSRTLSDAEVKQIYNYEK